jgi:hypothetical protein
MREGTGVSLDQAGVQILSVADIAGDGRAAMQTACSWFALIRSSVLLAFKKKSKSPFSGQSGTFACNRGLRPFSEARAFRRHF